MMEQLVKQMIANRLDIDISLVTNEARLVKDLKADSLDTVELLMEIERMLKLRIDDSSLGDISTVQNIIDLAVKLQATTV
jgi:acyl carrier protein